MISAGTEATEKHWVSHKTGCSFVWGRLMRLNRRREASLSTERIRKRLRAALQGQQHTALSREERESEEWLCLGTAGERPKWALETSTAIKRGPHGQRLVFGSHLLSEKNQWSPRTQLACRGWSGRLVQHLSSNESTFVVLKLKTILRAAKKHQ